ncbi:hypothetical protein HPP92_009367 [Vanilla planifolia]|uniref:Uncharacterized protein n=1 Tax=Vanilla planifolia TaxID=51239 RepID=A0A835V5D0_VANPL|nr:hypothetical protein HPP92_009367 [Vanilla planifolia]
MRQRLLSVLPGHEGLHQRRPLRSLGDIEVDDVYPPVVADRLHDRLVSRKVPEFHVRRHVLQQLEGLKHLARVLHRLLLQTPAGGISHEESLQRIGKIRCEALHAPPTAAVQQHPEPSQYHTSQIPALPIPCERLRRCHEGGGRGGPPYPHLNFNSRRRFCPPSGFRAVGAAQAHAPRRLLLAIEAWGHAVGDHGLYQAL